MLCLLPRASNTQLLWDILLRGVADQVRHGLCRQLLGPGKWHVSAGLLALVLCQLDGDPWEREVFDVESAGPALERLFPKCSMGAHLLDIS